MHAKARHSTLNRQQSITLDITLACFGHGEPLTRDAAAGFQAAARRLSADIGQHVRDVSDTPENPQ
jgi:hypothetical protein